MSSRDNYFRAFSGRPLYASGDVLLQFVQFRHPQPGFPRCAAMKQYNRKTIEFDREVSILQTLSGQSPHIVEYYHHFLTAAKGYIFMEWCECGSLAEEIERRKRERCPWTNAELHSHFESLVSAMSILHCHRIAHRDIKPENIFVKSDGTLKLGDFGGAKRVPGGRTDAESTLTGTAEYMSPQKLAAWGQVGKLTNEDCWSDDVWMMGRTFCEMAMCMRRPDLNLLTSSSAFAVYAEVESSLHFSGLSPSLTAMVMEMLNLVPKDRPTFQQLMQRLKGNGIPCGRCGSQARNREPFKCGDLLCAGCLLEFLDYVKQYLTDISQLVCPLCGVSIPPIYFQKHDFDPAASEKITKLALLSKCFSCSICNDLHRKYISYGDKAIPYTVQCCGKRICSYCLQIGGHNSRETHGDAMCPQFRQIVGRLQ